MCIARIVIPDGGSHGRAIGFRHVGDLEMSAGRFKNRDRHKAALVYGAGSVMTIPRDWLAAMGLDVTFTLCCEASALAVVATVALALAIKFCRFETVLDRFWTAS